MFVRAQVLLWRLREQEGQAMVEYAILVGFVAVAMAFVLSVLTHALNDMFSQAASQISTPPDTTPTSLP